MPVSNHVMHEDQLLMTLKGELKGLSVVASARSGSAYYTRASATSRQRSRPLKPQGERAASVAGIQRAVVRKLDQFTDVKGQLSIKILSKKRWVDGIPNYHQGFEGFWGVFQVPGNWDSIFGGNAEGDWRFRRGPWEHWRATEPSLGKLRPELPLILSPYCGTLFHEAVGHALEAEYIKGSPLKYRFGDHLSHDELTIMDRPDLEGLPGSMTHDDAGIPATPTTLIHRGHLVGDLTLGKGVMRRGSFRELPQIRATNFILRGGSTDPEGWRRFLPECYYVSWIQKGNWRPGSDKIKVLTGPVFHLKKGHSTQFRMWTSLEFNTLDLLSRIGGVGNDFTMDPVVHWCMKKNQTVPMGMGAPSLLIQGQPA